MSMFSTVGRMFYAYAEMRRLSRNERIIAALPPEIQKDIGWPDASARNRAARRNPRSLQLSSS
ncbi:hypothetical protein GN330_08365 [Nitratireductor sp. CAU 1489]|uniref:DUF1127 domain-containing protein n=1 Tax=Nitratireductor arenosus TaxID=2682096 RepID=A0A844QHQ5_9HYPH|nr:hypothetical protein [Nitratireductor arenosus]MVA97259.1 hypothetical protein [Nitratireductor arenosus]